MLFDEVVFIPYNNDFDISLTMLLNLLEPDVKVVKRLLLEEIKAENNALRTLVVCVGDCAVSLLARSVPDLKLYLSLAMRQRPEAEIDSNRGRIILDEIIVSKSDEQTRLADTGITEQHEFVKVVVLLSS